MTGMVALGFGFLFMQRMNEEDGIYESTEYEAPQPFDGGPDRVPAMVDLDDEDAEEDDDDLEVEGVDDTADVDTELKVEELHDELKNRLKRKLLLTKRSLKKKPPSRREEVSPVRKNQPNKKQQRVVGHR